MRKTIFNLALAGLLGLGMTAFAQDATTAPQPGAAMQGPSHRGFDADRQLEHMTKALNLTSDQQTQIKPILENQHQQMMQIRQDQSLSRQDRMTKFKSLSDDTHSKIEAVLNDQQKQKFEAMQQKMEERRQGHMQGGADAQPQAQPQQ
jgi:periplasmic protein CpxP/Spy